MGQCSIEWPYIILYILIPSLNICRRSLGSLLHKNCRYSLRMWAPRYPSLPLPPSVLYLICTSPPFAPIPSPHVAILSSAGACHHPTTGARRIRVCPPLPPRCRIWAVLHLRWGRPGQSLLAAPMRRRVCKAELEIVRIVSALRHHRGSCVPARDESEIGKFRLLGLVFV